LRAHSIVLYVGNRLWGNLATKQFKDKGLRLISIDSGKKAIELLALIHPDIIIYDEEIEDIPAREVFHPKRNFNHNTVIPFIYLVSLNKIEMESVGFADGIIIKPVEFETVADVVLEKLKRFSEIKKCFQASTNMVKQNEIIGTNHHILLENKNKSIITNIDDILMIISKGAYTDVLLKSGDKLCNITVRKLIKDWIAVLPEENFLKISRNRIININKIISIEKHNYSYLIKLSHISKPVIPSQRFASTIRKNFMV
jgi:DNA-binding LytR/AlgR family response regulator